MTVQSLGRRTFLSLALSSAAGVALAQEGLKEPVFRVANANSASPKPAAHPLDPAIEIAKQGLTHIHQHVKDYTCTIIKRERIKGTLGDFEYMSAKIRNRQVDASGKVATPFSVYLSFVKPETVKGREVIWVEGRNSGKLKAHEGGGLLGKLPSVWLDPLGPIAMRNQLYPISEIGVENLVAKLIERGEREKKFDEVEVDFIKGAKINGRVCTLLQVKHPVQREHFEFYLAQVFIDDELNVPVRYAAYAWPAKEGGQPQVLEEYTYVNLKVNVGLTEQDFDPENPNYRF